MYLLTVKGRKPVTMLMSDAEYNSYVKKKNRMKILFARHYLRKQLSKLSRYKKE